MELLELVSRCINQERQAQKELYEKYKNTLFVLCFKYCNDKTEAEDILHDVFIEIFSKIKNFKGNGSFEGWMKRIAINTTIDFFKKKSKIKFVDELIINDTPDEDFEESISMQTLLKFIQELPPQYRLVFNLYVLDEFSHKEIAEKFNISESTSKSNLHRARQILKNKITNHLV